MPIILMGAGVFLLLFFVADLFRYANARLKGKAFEKVWDDKTQDFVSNTLSRRIGLESVFDTKSCVLSSHTF